MPKPIILLQGAKGLGEAREAELLALLKKEAQQLHGELLLGHLCEVSCKPAWNQLHAAQG